MKLVDADVLKQALVQRVSLKTKWGFGEVVELINETCAEVPEIVAGGFRFDGVLAVTEPVIVPAMATQQLPLPSAPKLIHAQRWTLIRTTKPERMTT